MDINLEEFKAYPSEEEINKWIDGIWDTAEQSECEVKFLDKPGYDFKLGVWHAIEHSRNPRYVKFSVKGRHDFYCYWQPAPSGSAPLLVHLPGYGAEVSAHPDLVLQGYNVLHINPLGYATPDGPDESKKRDGDWPVIFDTFTSGAKEGYRKWLTDCVIAVQWALSQNEVVPNRISFLVQARAAGVPF